MLDNLTYYTDQLYAMMCNESFIPSAPTPFVRIDPHSGKKRNIKRPNFWPDQPVHWLIIMTLEPVFMRGMYYWSCGSVPGRGGKHARKYVRRCLDRDKRGTKYCLKLDIRRYYDSIPLDKLSEALKRKIKDPKMLRLLGLILLSTPEGIPIGNLTSQWLANFYLEPMDHFIKEKLGAKYYVRYVDDLVIMGKNKKALHRLRKELFAFMENELGLQVKDNWQVFPVKARGIDFVGYVFFHSYTKLRARNYLALTRQCRRAQKRIAAGKPIAFKMAAGLISRGAQLKHCDGQNIKRMYYDPVGEKRLKEVVRKHAAQQRRAA